MAGGGPASGTAAWTSAISVTEGTTRPTGLSAVSGPQAPGDSLPSLLITLQPGGPDPVTSSLTGRGPPSTAGEHCLSPLPSLPPETPSNTLGFAGIPRD